MKRLINNDSQVVNHFCPNYDDNSSSDKQQIISSSSQISKKIYNYGELIDWCNAPFTSDCVRLFPFEDRTCIYHYLILLLLFKTKEKVKGGVYLLKVIKRI